MGLNFLLNATLHILEKMEIFRLYEAKLDTCVANKLLDQQKQIPVT